MIKELKYLLYLMIIFLFIFFTIKYYFSESHKKKSYRALLNLNEKIMIFSQTIPTLSNDTQNIIEYVKNNQTKKKKKYYFWELLEKNE
tara:strand:- start:12238 stop:12501 length:264 start_codon:yes stop_codon:yes gene_type:complete